jgi:hypothetical protein
VRKFFLKGGVKEVLQITPERQWDAKGLFSPLTKFMPNSVLPGRCFALATTPSMFASNSTSVIPGARYIQAK